MCDDAGGMLAGVAAMEVLRELAFDGFGEIVVVATPDEEIGAPGSRDLLAVLGAEADAVLGLECARADGSLVCGRKGVADVVVRLRGRVAHAGIEPGEGASAALAAARLALAFDELNGDDVTVNTGVLRAGERSNVVAAFGELRAELRALDPAAFDDALDRMRGLSAGATVPAQLTVEAPVPPWRATAGTHRLLALAQEVGAEVGVDVRAAVTGVTGVRRRGARRPGPGRRRRPRGGGVPGPDDGPRPGGPARRPGRARGLSGYRRPVPRASAVSTSVASSVG